MSTIEFGKKGISYVFRKFLSKFIHDSQKTQLQKIVTNNGWWPKNTLVVHLLATKFFNKPTKTFFGRYMNGN